MRRNQTRAQEYGQIYKIVMDLFDKVTSLLGEEQMSIREYTDILDAGFSAAKVGMIPPGNDRVTVGDIERTRLNHIRILFFVGVNDGIVPKAGSTGSIISQFEREKMAEHHLMLAPGAREKVFIQKFYLYLNLTKPSDGLYVTYSRVSPEGKALRLLAASFYRYSGEPIGKEVARALYGTELENSVTRLEQFAECAFAHYMTYGLGLSQRELQEFAGVDMGNIYHDALWHFAERIRRSSYTWYDLPEQTRETWIEESMNDAIAGCANVGAFDEAKNRYLLSRMKDTIRRTVWALTIQVQKGRFTPSDFEVSFSQADHLEAIRFQLTEEEKMRLRGRIDRVDTCETDDKVYVKIIDYKSGNTTFSLLNLYHGLQLQLVVYMNAALELEAKKHPGKQAVPAGMFYYHIEDPMVDGSGTESEEEIRQAVLEELKPNGLVNDDPEIYGAMDTELSGSSAVIPVALKADGSLKATSKTASTEEFGTMSDYVKETMTKAGRRILGGDVAAAPYELDGRSGCDYCPYHMVCGFDARIPGFSYRKLEKPDGAEAILAKMRETQNEEKRQ